MNGTGIILTLAVCFAFSGGANAQRCFLGMWEIQVMGGMADGFYNSANR